MALNLSKKIVLFWLSEKKKIKDSRNEVVFAIMKRKARFLFSRYCSIFNSGRLNFSSDLAVKPRCLLASYYSLLFFHSVGPPNTGFSSYGQTIEVELHRP